MNAKKEEKIQEPIASRNNPPSLQVGENWQPPTSCEYENCNFPNKTWSFW
jgi:hypothetical protein